MCSLRGCLLPLLIVAALLGTALPAAAEESPTVEFTQAYRSFTPNGDGLNDVFEATLSVSAAARVRVVVNSVEMPAAVLLDREVDGAATLPVTWDGRFGETVQSNRTVTLYAIVDWAAGGSVTRQVQAEPYTIDGVELSSPGAGAVLFGEVPIRWKRHVYWMFDFDVSGCGSFRQNLGESGSQYPSSFDFSSAATDYQSFDAARCSPGIHTLTVKGKPGWGPGSEYLQVASIPIVIPEAGPQLAIQPDLAAADKIQTLLRYDNEQVAPISWPVRCRDADASSFVLRVRNAGGEVVRTFRGISTESDPCCSSKVTPGPSWDGRDDRGESVPDGRYGVEAEITDGAGRVASDRAAVVVQQAEPPLTLTSVSAGDSLGRSVPIVWRPAAGASIRTITVKVSGCEDRKPYGWYFGPPDESGSAQSIDVSMCPPGPRELTWTTVWRNSDGVQRVYTSRVPVTLVDVRPPSLRQWGYGNLLTPSKPGRMNIEWFLTCTDVSPVELDVVVRDSSGAAVAKLRETAPTFCGNWESNSHQDLSWDGVGSDGAVVPAGTYSVVAWARDEAGNTAESTWPIVVDARRPFTASIAAGGAVGAGDVITWTPRDGVSPIVDEPYPRATARLQGKGFDDTDLRIAHQADGRLLVSGVDARCVGHDAAVSVSIDWQDSAGDVHTWEETVPIRCVGSAQPVPKLAVRVTGTPCTDQTLGAQVTGIGSGEQPTYRWQRDGRDIVGATRDRYRLVAADVGHAIRARVSVTGHAARTAVSAATKAQPGVLVSAAPTVRGTSRVGQLLTGSSAAWRPSGVTLSYQWLRNGRPVTRATSSGYTLIAADRGTMISVQVTGRKAGYTAATRVSSATAKVR